MYNSKVRIRPAGESSDEDEYADFMSDNDEPIQKRTQVVNINVQERENERIFRLFLNGDLKDVLSLLDEGFDVNKRLRDDWTPLLLAASVGLPEITHELILRGADVNVHRDYYTPLMAAAACPELTAPYESSLLVVQQLLNKKADATAKTRKRITAFMYAASSGNSEVIKELLPYSDIAAEDNQGWTALFWAISSNHVEVVKLLLEEGLPYNKFDVRGNLPIYYAMENDFTNIIEILPSLSNQDDNLFVYKELGYQHFFDVGSSDFFHDVATMLYGMKNERNIEYFINNEIDLFKFLTLNEIDLIDMGIKMPYERYRILDGLYKFHIHPYKTKTLPIVGKSEPYSTINVANTVLSACRQIITMKASLRYILRNVSDLNELHGFDEEIKQLNNTLSKISNVVNQINLQAIEWDYETRPADLITKDSYKNLKSFKMKYFYVVSVLSLVAYISWKSVK